MLQGAESVGKLIRICQLPRQRDPWADLRMCLEGSKQLAADERRSQQGAPHVSEVIKVEVLALAIFIF